MITGTNNADSSESLENTLALFQHALQAEDIYQQHIARLLFEISCLDGLHQLAGDRSLPIAFRVRFQKIMELVDESLRMAMGLLRDSGFNVQCRTGCWHCCCHMPTGVSVAELLFMYHGMQQSRSASRLFRRCLEAEELWVASFYRQANSADKMNSDPPSIESLSKNYSRLEHPCPFLQGSLCSIYPYRPLACRMHLSFSPPPWCRLSHFQHPHALIINLEPGNCVFDALDNLQDRFQLSLSGVMVEGLLELTVNVMQFEKIRWV